MKDNFDLKRFLTENKTIENSNPYLKEAKEKKEKFDKSKLEKAIKSVLKKEGGAAGLKPLVDAAKKLGAKKKDLMDVLKKMPSVEKHRHGDYILKEEEMSDSEKEKVDREVDAVRDDLDQISKLAKDAGEDAEDIKSSLKERIREMIISELSEEMDPEDEESSEMDADEALSQQMDADEYETYADAFSSMPFEESLEEAKEDEEEVEAEETEDEGEAEEEISAEEETEETEEEPETGGGLEDIAADMEGDEGDLMDHLISALKVSKAMDNEKLTTQIGNTLKFFVGEYIGGEE